MPDFLDAQAMARKYPDTFFVLSVWQLDAIKRGDYIQVCRHNERFWVLVTRHDGEFVFGTVESSLIDKRNADLPLGAPIECELRHVLDACGQREMKLRAKRWALVKRMREIEEHQNKLSEDEPLPEPLAEEFEAARRAVLDLDGAIESLVPWPTDRLR